MITVHGKKEGTFYIMSGSTILTSVALSVVEAGVWHRRLRYMSEKGMKTLLSKDKLPGLKSIDLDFCEDYIYGKQRKVTLSKVIPKGRKVGAGLYCCMGVRPLFLLLMAHYLL